MLYGHNIFMNAIIKNRSILSNYIEKVTEKLQNNFGMVCKKCNETNDGIILQTQNLSIGTKPGS